MLSNLAKMKFIIADDHPLIVEGFEKVLKMLYADAVTYKAYNKIELLKVLEREHDAVLFLDIMFGTEDARIFVTELTKQYKMLKIIAISTLSDQITIDTMLDGGAKAYLVKSDSKDVILQAIKSVLNNEVFLSPSVKTHYRQQSKLVLSKREKEILILILKENTNKEIAAELNVSEKTVEHHRANLLIKFDAKNIAGLVRNAILAGYLAS